MRILGLEIVRKDGVVSIKKALPAGLQSVNSYRWNWGWNWWGPIQEAFTGAWQRNVETDPETSLLAFSAVFACVTGIASDIAKLRIKLSRNKGGIWEEVTDPHGNSAESTVLPLLRKPNRYQTRIQFLVQWIVSELLHGNTYVLKEREKRGGPVVAMYVLDPSRVKVLVAEDGSVWYEINMDHLSGVHDQVTLPASEIIHDRMVTLWHPLVGVSPIYACAMSGTMGNRIQANSTTFFANMSRPSGMLSAPGHISDETAARLKLYWETNFSGANVGKVAVAGDGLVYHAFTIPAETSQLIEQLRWTVEDVGRSFRYPQYKLGGPMPPYSSNLEALNMAYYTDCLQSLIESLELCLDEGLDLPIGLGTEMDLDNLMRMDTGALYDSIGKAIGGGWMAPNEGRFKADYSPVEGGNSPMIQQQNYSLAALAKRDAQENPFAVNQQPKPDAPEPSEKDLNELMQSLRLQFKEYAPR